MMFVDIMTRKDITPAAKLVYTIVADRCGSNGQCWPGQRLLATDTGLSRNAIIRALSNLESLDLVKIHRGHRGQTSFYSITASGAETGPESGSTSEPLEVAPKRGRVVPKRDTGGAETIPQVAPKRRHNQTDQRTRPKNHTTCARAESIYKLYPRKVGRKAAIAAIIKSLKTNSPEKLTEATKAYAEAVAKWDADQKRYIPNPSTWFNQERYDDDRATWIRASQNGPRGVTQHFDGGTPVLRDLIENPYTDEDA